MWRASSLDSSAQSPAVFQDLTPPGLLCVLLVSVASTTTLTTLITFYLFFPFHPHLNSCTFFIPNISFLNSNVVAVLRTSKFRRLCGDYIKAAIPDPRAMAVITEERDRLSTLGLLDDRSTELYNNAWQVSQVKSTMNGIKK